MTLVKSLYSGDVIQKARPHLGIKPSAFQVLFGLHPSKVHVCTKCTCMFMYSNGNASETKENKSFDNGVFFDIEAKRTPSIVRKLFSKQSEHIR
jgi:hypothetical protein